MPLMRWPGPSKFFDQHKSDTMHLCMDAAGNSFGFRMDPKGLIYGFVEVLFLQDPEGDSRSPVVSKRFSCFDFYS